MGKKEDRQTWPVPPVPEHRLVELSDRFQTRFSKQLRQSKNAIEVSSCVHVIGVIFFILRGVATEGLGFFGLALLALSYYVTLSVLSLWRNQARQLHEADLMRGLGYSYQPLVGAGEQQENSKEL